MKKPDTDVYLIWSHYQDTVKGFILGYTDLVYHTSNNKIHIQDVQVPLENALIDEAYDEFLNQKKIENIFELLGTTESIINRTLNYSNKIEFVNPFENEKDSIEYDDRIGIVRERSIECITIEK